MDRDLRRHPVEVETEFAQTGNRAVPLEEEVLAEDLPDVTEVHPMQTGEIYDIFLSERASGEVEQGNTSTSRYRNPGSRVVEGRRVTIEGVREENRQERIDQIRSAIAEQKEKGHIPPIPEEERTPLSEPLSTVPDANIPEKKPLLTEKRQDLLKLAAQGHTKSEIARKLGTSTATVKTTTDKIFDRLEVSTLQGAVFAFESKGGIDIDTLYAENPLDPSLFDQLSDECRSVLNVIVANEGDITQIDIGYAILGETQSRARVQEWVKVRVKEIRQVLGVDNIMQIGLVYRRHKQNMDAMTPSDPTTSQYPTIRHAKAVVLMNGSTKRVPPVGGRVGATDNLHTRGGAEGRRVALDRANRRIENPTIYPAMTDRSILNGEENVLIDKAKRYVTEDERKTAILEAMKRYKEADCAYKEDPTVSIAENLALSDPLRARAVQAGAIVEHIRSGATLSAGKHKVTTDTQVIEQARFTAVDIIAILYFQYLERFPLIDKLKEMKQARRQIKEIIDEMREAWKQKQNSILTASIERSQA